MDDRTNVRRIDRNTTASSAPSSPIASFSSSLPDDNFEEFADLYRRHGRSISNELLTVVDDQEWAERMRDILFFKMMLQRRP